MKGEAATPLSTIIALARAGALDHAWYEFGAAGYHAQERDPAALTVKGRLLKDRAIRASGEERRRLFVESADAYERAAEVRPGTYPLINAATLALLAGDRGRAAAMAGEVLARIEQDPDEPETAYWKGATEAEALLLVGRLADARARLAAALGAAPHAWEDHASTLRQFILIHQAMELDAGWLDMLRPPLSLHYGDGSSRASAVPAPTAKREALELIADRRCGFGFGSLAAGGDIEIAEAVLESGAELHLVLAGDPDGFARSQVDPHGASWRKRFDAAFEAAESVHIVRPLGPPGPWALALAHVVAAGAARLNAERLMSATVELAELDVAARTGSPDGPAPVALLAVRAGSASDEDFESRLEAVCEALEQAAVGSIRPHLSGDDIVLGFGDVAAAAAAARALRLSLRGRLPVRLAGHLGFIPTVRDPFLGASRPTEEGAEIVRAIMNATPPDSICVSLDFAAALAAGVEGPTCASWIGELQAFDGGPAIALYSLRPTASGD